MSLSMELEGFLPAGVQFTLRDPRRNYPLIGAEQQAVARAVTKRKNEFSAGRDGARASLAALGVALCEIPVGVRRAPVWPDGICGSITHSAHLCIALAARKIEIASIGIDAEPDAPLKPELRSAILHESELHVSGAEAIALFSMKEALFKALFPISGEMMGFHDAKSDGASTLTLTRDIGVFKAGEGFKVSTLHSENHVISFCALPGDNE